MYYLVRSYIFRAKIPLRPDLRKEHGQGGVSCGVYSVKLDKGFKLKQLVRVPVREILIRVAAPVVMTGPVVFGSVHRSLQRQL